ncbi:signal peptidase II [Patescibacteria group bacterium]|nr:MAG: signal peptidase II [Patescibacteria group bacterium]
MRRSAYILPIVLIGVDQALKWYSQHLLPSQGVFLVPGLLGFEPFQNPGIAFGIPVPGLVLTLGSLALALGFGALGVRRGNLGALLVAAGGLSNAIDRVFFGVTFDYIRIGPWSLVNLADGMIVAGLLLFLLRPTSEPAAPSA